MFWTILPRTMSRPISHHPGPQHWWSWSPVQRMEGGAWGHAAGDFSRLGPSLQNPPQPAQQDPGALPFHLEALSCLARKTCSRCPRGKQALCHSSRHLPRGTQRSEAGPV